MKIRTGHYLLLELFLFLLSQPISTSVLQLLVEISEAMEMLSNSSMIFLPAIFRAMATIPITPAMVSMVMTKMGTMLLLYEVWVVVGVASSFTKTKIFHKS